MVLTEDFKTRHTAQWQASWQALSGQPGDPALHDALVARYDEPHRHYHTLQHLDACLRHLPALRSQARHPDEILLALWFHDAIYEIGAADNETRSADWAAQAVADAGVKPDVTRRIHALVMATRHDGAPQSGDQQVLLDVDLAILGAPADVFDRYELQIRAEYQSVAEPAFRSNRCRILQGFLARQRIYHTPLFFAQRETQARTNLTRSIAALQAAGG